MPRYRKNGSKSPPTTDLGPNFTKNSQNPPNLPEIESKSPEISEIESFSGEIGPETPIVAQEPQPEPLPPIPARKVGVEHMHSPRGDKLMRPPTQTGQIGPWLTPQGQERHAIVLHELYDEIGHENALRILLQSDDERLRELYRSLINPKFDKKSFPALCRRVGLTIADIIDACRNYNLHIGIVRMARHVPDVLEDTSIDARSRYVNCPRCDGKKEIHEEFSVGEGEERMTLTDTRQCPECDGVGKIRKAGDRDSRNLVFESMGLTGKRAMVAIQQNNYGVPEGLEGLVAATERFVGSGRAMKEEEDGGKEESS